MTDEQLRAIKVRESHAAPGPWRVIRKRIYAPGPDGFPVEIDPYSKAHRDFVANARQDIPDLVDEVERLRAAIGQIWALTGPGDIVSKLAQIERICAATVAQSETEGQGQ